MVLFPFLTCVDARSKEDLLLPGIPIKQRGCGHTTSLFVVGIALLPIAGAEAFRFATVHSKQYKLL